MEPPSVPQLSAGTSSFDPTSTLPAGVALSKLEEEEKKLVNRIRASEKRQRKEGIKIKDQLEVDQLLKELQSAAGCRHNWRYQKKEDDPKTIQFCNEVKGKIQWKDVVPFENTDQCCMMEWRRKGWDSDRPGQDKKDSFVTHMVNKFYMNGHLVKQWYDLTSRPLSQATSVALALASMPQSFTGASSLDPASTLGTTTTGGSEGASNAALLEGLTEVTTGLVELTKTVKAGQLALAQTVDNNKAVMEMLAMMEENRRRDNEKMLETMKTQNCWLPDLDCY
jgi:hypothetical protein